MKKVLVQIQSNCFYNYEKENDNPIWRFWGTQIFNIYVPYDLLVESGESCIEAYKLMLFEESSDKIRYEYVDDTILWSEPKQLHDTTFLEKLQVASILSNCE